MTREEAIAVLEESKRQNEVMRDNPSTFWASNQMVDGIKNSKRRIAALDLALSALRPVSREQVEKVWRGEWIGDNDEKVGTIDGSPIKSATCSACGNWLVGSDEYDCAGYFCLACGRAMTDEAVDMILERWKEALENG